jgi:predicted MFS family arabinose efflux permease
MTNGTRTAPLFDAHTFGASIKLLGTRRFGTFWFASLLSNIGTWTQQVAQPWLLLSIGATPLLIGLDAFALGAPVWLLTLVGGALADRSDRRRIIATFQSIQMLCPVMLVVLLLMGTVKPWMIISLSLVVGITDALSMPSFQSIVPSIVEHSQIAAGLALNSTQFNLSRILGPAIAGVLLAGVGAAGCFAVSAASYLPFIAVALWILPRWVAPTSVAPLSGARQMWLHVCQVAGRPGMRGAISTVFVTSLLCAQLVTFSPVLIKDAFHGTSGQFSVAVASFGVGGLLGAMGLLFIGDRVDRRVLNVGFALLFGVILVLAALNPWSWAVPLLLMGAGLSMGVSNISANTLVQADSTVQLRGQAVSMYMLAMRGGLSIGSLLTGLSVSVLGVSHALLINGALAIAALAVIGEMWRRASRSMKTA